MSDNVLALPFKIFAPEFAAAACEHDMSDLLQNVGINDSENLTDDEVLIAASLNTMFSELARQGVGCMGSVRAVLQKHEYTIAGNVDGFLKALSPVFVVTPSVNHENIALIVENG